MEVDDDDDDVNDNDNDNDDDNKNNDDENDDGNDDDGDVTWRSVSCSRLRVIRFSPLQLIHELHKIDINVNLA